MMRSSSDRLLNQIIERQKSQEGHKGQRSQPMGNEPHRRTRRYMTNAWEELCPGQHCVVGEGVAQRRELRLPGATEDATRSA